MFGLSRKWPRRTAQFAAAGMLAASGSMFFASTALAAPAAGAGNNGTVQVNGEDFKNGNDPHLTCPITIKWAGFDPAGNKFTVTFTGINPTGGTVSVVGGANPDSGSFVPAGADFQKTYQLQIANGSPNNKNEFHVNIDVMTETSTGGSQLKSKTVWLGSCVIVNPVQTVTLASTCNHGTGNYDWTLQANQNVAVSGTYTPSGGAATNYTTNAADGLFSFNTAHSQGPVTFTVPAGYTAVNSGATATHDAACDAPVVVQPSATAAADCTALTAHLVGGTNGATFDIVHNGVTDHVTLGKGATQDVSYGSAAGANITVSVGGTQKATATASNSCGGNPANPTPASATANADCSALTAHLDGGTNGATFTVTEPGGSHSVVVPAGGTDNVSYGSGNGDVITVSVGATVLDTKSAPTNCTVAPGQADPAVSEINHCTSGMNLTLSNMNGSADATFTVTDPDGNSQQVGVRAGQLKKLAFAVTEDTTGTVSVSAPGLAKKTFTYNKNCATVLGVKHTRKPVTKPVVKGEHSQLPFTGFETQRALLDGAALFFLGAVLCILGARRRDEEMPY
jgi:hypothetical protein